MASKKHPLRFETERLKDGSVEYDLTETPEVMGLAEDPEYRFIDPVRLNFKLTLLGDTVLLKGRISTIARNTCARCLEDIGIPLSADVTIAYMTDPRLLDPERYPELVDDDTHYYDGEAIDPGEHLRELLLLELPTVPACELQEGDFCPVRKVKLEPMVFGPAEEFEKEAAAVEDDDSLAGKLKKVRKDLN